jgi:hypothetical protein
MSSKYYYLIAGLPNLSIEDGKLPFNLLAFREEIEHQLSKADRALLHLLFLKFDNKNLLAHLRHPDSVPESGGSITAEEFGELIRETEEPAAASKSGKKHLARIPDYFRTFIYLYHRAGEKEEQTVIPWEDRLATLYYEYAMQCGNAFLAAWFELNLHINNLLAAITCRKFGLNRADYIVGNDEWSQLLRTSGARDFGWGDMFEYLPAVLRIAEDADLLARERKIDRLKWDWLDEQTVFKTFTVESVLAYLLKIEMTERWAKLDKAAGEQMFRTLVGAMKTGSNNALNEFKRNNKK